MVNCRAMKTENTVKTCEAVSAAPFHVSAKKVTIAAKMVIVGEIVLAAEEAKAIFLRPATSLFRTSLIWSAKGVSHAYILIRRIELIISISQTHSWRSRRFCRNR